MSENSNLNGSVSNLITPVLSRTFLVKPHEPFADIYRKYAGHGYGPLKLMVSLYNAILKHRLVAFVIDEQSTIRLYERDQNWQLKSKVNPLDVRAAIDIMIGHGSIEVLQPASGFRPAVYGVVDPTLTTEIRQTAIEYLWNKKMVHEYLNKF